MKRNLWAVLLVALVAGGAGQATSRDASPRRDATADAITLLPTEGMWAYDKLPEHRLRDLFHFDLTQSWADHVRLSSARVGGASGAFVSPDGLILTNQHVAAGGLQNASGPGRDFVTNGFLAKSRDQEVKLPGVEVSVLESIEDVTARVNAAVDPKLTGEAAVKARNAIFALIEAESQRQTGLHSSVVTLYGGAVYDLYRYKRYTDVRCAFAPEMAIAFLGGDPDNFEYPRYDLDITLLRAYENDKPAQVEHYLRVSARGVREGDLVFVSGDPGSTDRLLPVAALLAMRDLSLPLRLQGLERSERVLIDYSGRGAEQRRQAQRQLFGVENGLKALRPRLGALRSPEMIDQKRRQESAMRDALAGRPDLQSYTDAWDQVAAAEQRRAALMLPYSFLEQGQAFSSSLFGYARTLVRMTEEDPKPDDQRLPEYTQANRGPLLHRLLAPVPVYPELETARLADSLRFFREKLGGDSPLVNQVLSGKNPEDRATESVAGSRLADPAERKRLLDGGSAAIRSSDDPMIALARLIDPDARRIRREYESQVSEPMTRALTLINRARFALYGSEIYPDATGTLRLAFGLVKGYEQGNEQIPAWTTIVGAFKHAEAHEDKPPYQLPQSWREARGKLTADTPFNFVSTADIIGGNSGSPVVDREGELVGVVFDSNRQGVAGNLAYSDAQARAVSVDSRAIVEALRTVYAADGLLNELLGDQTAAAAAPEGITYPQTRRGDQHDTYFGRTVADPYRWLEDDNSPQTKQWVKEQDAVTEAYLAKIPYRRQVKARLQELYNYAKYSAPFHRGQNYFFYKNDGLQNQPVLYVQHGLDGAPEVLIDPNRLSKDGTSRVLRFEPSMDGEHAAYAVSVAGSDWMEVHVIDVAARRTLPDTLKWVKASGLAWQGNGFYYSRYDAPPPGKELLSANQNQKVYYHRVGTPQEQDTLEYENPSHPQRFNTATTTQDEQFLILDVSDRGSGKKGNALFYRATGSADRTFKPLVPDITEDEYEVIDDVAGGFLVRTNHGAPNNRVVLIDPGQPAEAHWKPIVAQAPEPLKSAVTAGRKLFTIYLKDVTSRVIERDLDGKPLTDVELPALGTAGGFWGLRDDTEVFYTFTSFTFPPTIYRYDLAGGKSTLFRTAHIPDLDPEQYVTRQVFYASKDGTRVPMFLVHKKGLAMDGNNPTLLYGYGGFDITLGPSFNSLRLALLEQGFAFAQANLRGGGEYGEVWHEAGTKLHKQNVFDDFIAAAQWLIDNKVTSPTHLAIQGGSNGGLLVGAVLNQRPELFKAAIAQVGVMDMLRYQKFTIGWNWKPDYGSSDDPAQFKALYAYSPLHNVHSGVVYPATLITTADHDDRVVPGHSFKYAATMQATVAGGPVLIRIDTNSGHGASSVSKVLDEGADVDSFLMLNLGASPKY